MRMIGLLAVAVAILLLAGFSTTPSLAVRGGRHQATTAATGKLTVSPNPVGAYGASYYVYGSGFQAGQNVHLSLADPGCCSAFTVVARSDGSLYFSARSGDPGTYQLNAYQWVGQKLVLMAATSFTVR